MGLLVLSSSYFTIANKENQQEVLQSASFFIMSDSAAVADKALPHARIIVYSELKNASSILNGISSIDQRIVVADLSLVVSCFHLQLATYKALLNESQGRMKTKSIASEVLYQLSSSTKITDAIQQYSIRAESTDIAFVYITPAGGSASTSMTTDDALLGFKSQIQSLAIEGKEVDPQEISSSLMLTDEKSARIAKYFKITPQELEVSGLEESVATRLAVKDSL
jgi:tRNA threonylcarbamoyladenosine modification (KEOPS) complex Cgi121 subunit